FAAVLVPERSLDEPNDTLTLWARGRNESIAMDNAIAVQIGEDPVSINSADLGLSSFTSFPLIGLTSVGPRLSGLYSSYYQSGFNSIYWPGYSYRRLFVGIAPRTFGRSFYSAPLYSPSRRVGVPGGIGTAVPRAGAAVPRPAHAPARPAPHGVARGGGRR